jgi:hypothetical protein
MKCVTPNSTLAKVGDWFLWWQEKPNPCSTVPVRGVAAGALKQRGRAGIFAEARTSPKPSLGR